jgi:hypothetical protein
VRFVDFLRAAVLLFAGSANALAIVTLVGSDPGRDRVQLYAAFGWWIGTAAIGGFLGRRPAAFRGVARLMATARATPALPELEPGTILVNRLWSLAVFTVVAGGLGVVFPQVAAIAVGFPLMAAFAVRKQAGAAQAVEERDGVRFYVDRTPALRATRLVRTPGLKRWVDAADDMDVRERESARQRT